jgi:hypothetical protein
MGSRYKHAHKTHALKSAGDSYPDASTDGLGHPGLTSEDGRLLGEFAQFCERFPDAAERADKLRASVELDADWQAGKKLPLLRARRKLIEQALKAPS